MFLLLLAFALPSRAEEPFRDLGFNEALAQAKKEKKLLMVDFYATWCGPCKMMDRTTWKDPKVREWIRTAAVAIKVQGDRQREISSKHRITGFPTVVFLKPDGAEAGRVSGYRPPEEFLLFARASAEGKDILAYLKTKTLPNGKPDPEARLRAAMEMLQARKYDEALAELQWCIESGAAADPSFAAAYPQVLSLLGRMGPIRPAASELLRRTRDKAAGELSEGKGDTGTAEILGAANEMLGEQARTVEAYDRVKAQGDARRAVRETLYRYGFRQLHAAKRYEDIIRDAGDPAKLGETLIGYYKAAVGPAPPQPGDPQAGSATLLRERVVGEAAMLFEALLGVGKNRDARSLAEQILDWAPSGSHYALFFDHANRAGVEEEARFVRARGVQLLPATELSVLEGAAPPSGGQPGG